jgi:hypothetical protein
LFEIVKDLSLATSSVVSGMSIAGGCGLQEDADCRRMRIAGGCGLQGCLFGGLDMVVLYRVEAGLIALRIILGKFSSEEVSKEREQRCLL